MQIPPVGGRPCFSVLMDSSTTYGRTGYVAYMAVNFVVFLVENMRQMYDPNYTAILRRMRWAALTDDDLNALNSRVINTPAMFSQHRQRRSQRHYSGTGPLSLAQTDIDAQPIVT